MSRNTHVVVGYDGTRESELAVRWAAEEARRRYMTLTLCHAWRWPYPISHIDYDGVAIVKRMGEHIMHRGASIAVETAPRVTVREVLMDGPAASALLHHCLDAEMIVVGSHERNDLPVGSSALHVPARASCPVVVVRDPGPTDGRVVVGVDGSAGADAALGFAFQEAQLRGWRLQAVYGCWEPGAAPDSDIALYGDTAELKRVCGARLERAVAPWCEKYPQVDARTRLVTEEPRSALLEAAEGADLIVVGDRGQRGLHPLLLGTTTLALLQLSPCSVAVVHP